MGKGASHNNKPKGAGDNVDPTLRAVSFGDAFNRELNGKTTEDLAALLLRVLGAPDANQEGNVLIINRDQAVAMHRLALRLVERCKVHGKPVDTSNVGQNPGPKTPKILFTAIDTLCAIHDDIGATVQTVTELVAKSKSEIESLTEQLKGASLDKEASERQLKAVQEELNASNQRHEEQRVAHEQAIQRQTTEHAASITALKQESEAQRTALESARIALKTTFDALEASHTELGSRFDALSQAHTAAQAEITRLQRELTEAQQSHKSIQSELDKAREAFAALEARAATALTNQSLPRPSFLVRAIEDSTEHAQALAEHLSLSGRLHFARQSTDPEAQLRLLFKRPELAKVVECWVSCWRETAHGTVSPFAPSNFRHYDGANRLYQDRIAQHPELQLDSMLTRFPSSPENDDFVRGVINHFVKDPSRIQRGTIVLGFDPRLLTILAAPPDTRAEFLHDEDAI